MTNQPANSMSGEQAYSVAMQMIKMCKYRSAKEVIDKLQEIAPTNRKVFQVRMSLEEAQRRYQPMIEIAKEWVVSQPESLDAKAHLARAYRLDAQYAESNETIASMGQEFPETINMQVENLIYLGETEAACTLALTKCVGSTSFASRYNLGVVSAIMQNFSAAEEYFSAILADEKSNKNQQAGVSFFLGVVKDQQGDAAGAEKMFDQALAKSARVTMGRIESYKYMQETTCGTPVLLWSPGQIFENALQAAPAQGLNMEFGVRHGRSLRYLANQDVAQKWHGFDSFEGLPEAWGGIKETGLYTTSGHLPKVPENVTLHQGWFDKTLPEFIEEHNNPVRFINIDCDIYSATKTVLETLQHNFQSGSVLVFDEYIGNKSWREDEHKAFQEFIQLSGWQYEYLSYSFYSNQVVVKLIAQK